LPDSTWDFDIPDFDIRDVDVQDFDIRDFDIQDCDIRDNEFRILANYPVSIGLSGSIIATVALGFVSCSKVRTQNTEI